MVSPFVIREAMLEDAAVICAVHKSSVRQLCAATYSLDQIEAWIGSRTPENYARAMSSGESMFVAELGGRVVGFASIRDDTLLALYVEPENGRGAGTPLVLRAEEALRSNRANIVSLNATLNAAPFY